MKLLIYGFGPYLQYGENITEKIITRIRKNHQIQTIIFPASFDKNDYLDVVDKINPDMIIGLGQHPRARKIRIERKAKNIIQKDRKKEPKRISCSGRESYFATLKISQSPNARLSYDAGKHACNFSMYEILRHAKNAKLAFIHFPKDYDLDEAVDFVEKIIRQYTFSTALPRQT